MIDIPFIDIRNDSQVKVLVSHADKAQALIEASKGTFGMASKIASLIALPVGDYISRGWLEKSKNPYLNEILEYAKILPLSGVIALNMSYEWGCTSGVYRQESGFKLIRVLDWPFRALGENIVVLHQSGKAGDFYNVTWPAISGVFQAVAPKRFAAALNQAPMRRYKTGIVLDWCKNRIKQNRSTALPPAHLLRKVFEEALDYDEAKKILAEHPLCMPVIYTLSGTTANQACVIERLEDSACIREIDYSANVSAANHFETALNGVGHGWLPRANDSYGRSLSAKLISGVSVLDGADWFKTPVANNLSRLVMIADAKTGHFSVMGVDGMKPVTNWLRVLS